MTIWGHGDANAQAAAPTTNLITLLIHIVRFWKKLMFYGNSTHSQKHKTDIWY